MAEREGIVTDVLGNDIKVGDQIAGAFRIGNVAVLRVGTVLGFAQRGGGLTVRVQWHHSSRKENDVVGAIEADLGRFVLVNAGVAGLIAPAVAPPVNDEVPVVNP